MAKARHGERARSGRPTAPDQVFPGLTVGVSLAPPIAPADEERGNESLTQVEHEREHQQRGAGSARPVIMRAKA